jgi:hypothetical protein
MSLRKYATIAAGIHFLTRITERSAGSAAPRAFASRSPRRAGTIYGRIKAQLKPSFKGNILAIAVESGEHFIGETVLEATRKARARHPTKVFQFFRIGFPTVYVWR